MIKKILIGAALGVVALIAIGAATSDPAAEVAADYRARCLVQEEDHRPLLADASDRLHARYMDAARSRCAARSMQLYGR